MTLEELYECPEGSLILDTSSGEYFVILGLPSNDADREEDWIFTFLRLKPAAAVVTFEEDEDEVIFVEHYRRIA